MPLKPRYQTEQPKLGLVGRVLARLSSRAIDKLGSQRATVLMAAFTSRLPRWYITPLATKEGVGYLQIRKEFLVADKLVMMKHGQLRIEDWAGRPQQLTREDWEAFSDILTGALHADDGLVWPQTRLWEALAERRDLTWAFAEKIFNSSHVEGDEKIRMITFLADRDPVAEMWHDGGELLRWIMKQEEKEQYLKHFSGNRLVGMAKQMSTGEEWLLLMEELIKISPQETLQSVAYSIAPVQLHDEFAWVDDGHMWEQVVNMPRAIMDDFEGANRQMFNPWLTGEGLSKEDRMLAIKWLVEFDKAEAKRLEREKRETERMTPVRSAPNREGHGRGRASGQKRTI